MKNLFIIFALLFLTAGLSAQQNYQFKTADAGDNGMGFYSLDKKTGQAYYMWDTGDNAGKWTKYGNTIDAAGTGSFEFQLTYRGSSNGAGFYALECKTGQVYFMWDSGDNAGKWKKYGGVIDAAGKSDFRFSIADRGDSGMGFYALDGKSGQVYFMWDTGDNAGKWTKYGEAIK